MLVLKHRALAAAALSTILFAASGHAADGQPDPGFGIAGFAYLTPDDVEARELRPYAGLALPDGKLLFAGERNKFIPSSPFDPHMRGMLARVNADGSADTTFGNVPGIPGVLVLPDLVPDTGAGSQVIEAMQRMDDGSIIVAGTAQAFGPLRGFVVKLDADGTMDPGFGDAGVARLPNVHAHALAIDGQGRIVVGGEKSINSLSHSFVTRLDADGTVDTSFGDNGDVVIDWDGVADQGGSLTSLAITADDGILAGGSYEVYGMGMGGDFAIARLGANGAFDTRFAGTGWRVFHSEDLPASMQINGIDRMLPTAAGGAVFAGHYNDDDSGTQIVLGRVNADGSSDATFGDAATPGFQPIAIAPEAWNRYPTGLARQADGKLVVSASYATPDKSKFAALRVSTDGLLDTSFGDAGMLIADAAPDGVFSDASVLLLDAGDHPILAGIAELAPTPPLYYMAMLRLTHDAVDDRIFGDGFEAAVETGAMAR